MISPFREVASNLATVIRYLTKGNYRKANSTFRHLHQPYHEIYKEVNDSPGSDNYLKKLAAHFWAKNIATPRRNPYTTSMNTAAEAYKKFYRMVVIKLRNTSNY